MDTLFIDFYNNAADQIDSNLNHTHDFTDESDVWVMSKDDCKREIVKMLNSDPEDLEPLYSRLAKCKASIPRHYMVHVFDGEHDENHFNIGEYLNGKEENGFSGLSILVEFEEGDQELNESVYIRFTDYGEFCIYDLKPCHRVSYEKNSDKIEDTSSWGEFKKNNPREAEYVIKWQNSNKDLDYELEKWSDMLWLGRSLAFHDSYPEEQRKGVLEIERKVIEKYKDDPDFQKYMYDTESGTPDEEYGDSKWTEINLNTGALRYLCYGEFDLDS